MKKKILLSLALILVIVVGVSGYCWWVSKTSNPWNAETIGHIPTPIGFERDEVDGYGEYLRSLPLKKRGAKVHLFTGGLANFQWLSAGVIDIPLLSNAEQCADMTMRIRAEYLWQKGSYSKIRFTDVNGKTYSYNGGASRKAFEKYMKRMYGICSTFSVYHETEVRNVSDVRPGDVLVYPARKLEGMGHAVLVADVATNSKGQKAILCIEGNTPARECHVVRNINPLRKAWSIIDDSDKMFLVSCFLFNKNELRHY